LITWNVDFFMEDAPLRLAAALDYLQLYAFPAYEGWQPPPCLILLQEVERDAFLALLAHPWVQAWFMVVPGSPQEGWPQGGSHGYGTVTLIARSVMLTSSACVHFEESRMGRNALVTDVLLGGAEPQARVLRVINTHLESLPSGAQRRAAQFDVIARLLRSGGTGPVFTGGIVCGDMNAIVRSDAMLPKQNGLLDAWEEQRRRHRRRRWSRRVWSEGEDEEEDVEGMTWGYQPPCEFPPGRLDKILYTESDAFEMKGIRRLGIEVKMSTLEGRLNWVSDHYGLLCHVEAR
jgi:tyrosyl-DNA phosphodiesterase 2